MTPFDQILGDLAPLTAQNPAMADLSLLQPQSLLSIDVKTINGQGGTPTTPGAGKNVTLNYAFSPEVLAAADAPALLANKKTTLVCPLPDSNSALVPGTRYNSPVDPVLIANRYLYVWVDTDAFGSVNSKVRIIVNLYGG